MLIAAVVTYLVVPLVRAIAMRLGGQMDIIRERDAHSQVTPRLGGVAMLCGAASAWLVAAEVPFLREAMNGADAWAVLGAGTLVCAVGAIDDVWSLDAMTRLAAQSLAGLMLVWQGVQLVSLPVFGVTVGSSSFLMLLSVLVVVATINAVNTIDGLDGLVSGVVLIAGSAFFLYTYQLTREANRSDYSSLGAVIAVVMVGVCLGFLPHNANPAQIFMGDAGAYLIGLLLASAMIVVTGQVDPGLVSEARLVPVYGPMLFAVAVLLIPALDLFLAVVRRAGAGRGIFSADREHLHHQLIDRLGHSHRGAVWVMYAWAFVSSYGVVAFSFLENRWAAPVVGSGVVGAVLLTLWPRMVGSRTSRSGGSGS